MNEDLPKGKIPRKGPGFFFWYGMVCVLLLLLLALWYSWAYDQTSNCLLSLFCVTFSDIDPVGGLLPLGVPWFGALGGVTISLYGVFDHNDDWDPKWNYWHLARPVLGALLATVAFFIFYVLITAAGQPPPIDDGDVQKRVVLYVLAFLVGYRESTFKELIKRVSDVILKPADAPATEPAPDEPSTQRPTLRRGSKGKAVQRAQRLLTKAGHKLRADGVFGPKMEATVRAFQEDRSLVPDGIVGPKTWDELQSTAT